MGHFCDLHTHSTCSDGTCTPSEIIRRAQALGLGAVALTDHNTTAGLPEFLSAAEGTAVQAIAGVELSTEYRGRELHIVGLFLPRESFSPLTAYLEDYNRRKAESNYQLVQALNKLGYRLDYNALLASHPNGTMNRAVIAAALAEKGYFFSVANAFHDLLSTEAGYFEPPKRPDALEAIAFLRTLGAVPVLAHAFLNLDEAGLRQFLPEAIPAGLLAMETLYPTFSPAMTHTAQQIAREFGLLSSGGSDFHGSNKPHIRLGTGTGGLAVPMAFARELEKAAGRVSTRRQ